MADFAPFAEMNVLETARFCNSRQHQIDVLSQTSKSHQRASQWVGALRVFVRVGVDMVVSGLPQENGILHASEIASMALDLVGVCRTFRIPHKPSMQLQIRAGIHSGTRTSLRRKKKSC